MQTKLVIEYLEEEGRGGRSRGEKEQRGEGAEKKRQQKRDNSRKKDTTAEYRIEHSRIENTEYRTKQRDSRL